MKLICILLSLYVIVFPLRDRDYFVLAVLIVVEYSVWIVEYRISISTLRIHYFFIQEIERQFQGDADGTPSLSFIENFD